MTIKETIMPSKKVTRDDLRQAAEKYKNWGKWGADDEIGTLNYTSAGGHRRRGAAGQKRQGDLARAQLRQ